MNDILVVWSSTGDLEFEEKVPLTLLGKRNRSMGLGWNFDVLFAEGINHLSPGYKDELLSLGFKLHDREQSYRALEKKYRQLARFGDYERKCFLRWLVIKEFAEGAPFNHFDADVVFNATRDELDFSGLTFVLQGCPAYARVEDPSWLKSYEEELDRFVADVEGYSAEAWRERRNFVDIYKSKNSALWDRTILSSDQDLLQFLTLSGRIPQADRGEIDRVCSAALFQNPLTIGDDISLPLPLRYERKNGVDFIGGRKVGFWHMQGDFCDYLAYATFRKRLGIRGRVRWRDATGTPSHGAYRLWKKFSGGYSRRMLVHRYFDSNWDLSFLLNDRTYWKKDVFL